MRQRQALPRLWLMTDERQGDALLPALRRLPKGSGVVFRHYTLPAAERRTLFAAVRRIARARRLVLMLAGSAKLARAWRADGRHGRGAGRGMLHSAPVHNHRELAAAKGADLVFISPVFPTRSHPGARALGRLGFRMLARAAQQPAIALGGMNADRLRGLGAYGWAGIDALTG